MKRLLRMPGTQILCALAFAFLLNWPVITSFLSVRPLLSFILIYVVWILGIVLLYLIQRSIASDDDGARG